MTLIICFVLVRKRGGVNRVIPSTKYYLAIKEVKCCMMIVLGMVITFTSENLSERAYNFDMKGIFFF